MPKDVNLNISDTQRLGRKWVKVIATDGTPYWYMFLGGNSIGGNGNGNNRFQIVGTPPSETFDVSFRGNLSNTYRFLGFFNKTVPSDLSGAPDANGDKITVTDGLTIPAVGTPEAHFDWGVIVAPRSDLSVTFNCDPVVTNWR